MNDKQLRAMLKKVIVAVLEKYGEVEGGKILNKLYEMMEGLRNGG